jgi:restriction endonuclease Mrr
MAVPDYQALMMPLLKALEDGAEHQVRDLREQISKSLGLTDADQAQMLPRASSPSTTTVSDGRRPTWTRRGFCGPSAAACM